MNKEYTFEDLVEKANKCLLCAMRSQSDWAYNFWYEKAKQLKDKAFALPIYK